MISKLKELMNKITKAGLLHFVRNDNTRKKVAFTLAEVLITLGIIGVVAAMTIPALNQKMKNIVVETRLKKFYAEMNQAVRLSEADNGDKMSWQADNVEEYWEKYYKPYLKYTKVLAYKKYSNTNEFLYIEMKNGSVFSLNLYRERNDNSLGGHFEFFSSKKCYNSDPYTFKWGQCKFLFGFWPASQLSDFRYHYNKNIEPYLVHWTGKKSDLYTDTLYGCNKNGYYCTAIIKFNNWKIPKDYPFKVWY